MTMLTRELLLLLREPVSRPSSPHQRHQTSRELGIKIIFKKDHIKKEHFKKDHIKKYQERSLSRKIIFKKDHYHPSNHIIISESMIIVLPSPAAPDWQRAGQNYYDHDHQYEYHDNDHQYSYYDYDHQYEYES